MTTLPRTSPARIVDISDSSESDRSPDVEPATATTAKASSESRPRPRMIVNGKLRVKTIQPPLQPAGRVQPPQILPTRSSTAQKPVEDPYMALLDGTAVSYGQLVDRAVEREEAASRELAKLSALAHTQNTMAERLRVAGSEIDDALHMVGTMQLQAPTFDLQYRGGMPDRLERLSNEIREVQEAMNGRQRALEAHRTATILRRCEPAKEIAELMREEDSDA
uniref:Uncharacterized protein n=1 Tax=Mycena chlorophos TaxID=658473 RepID=A0ABQ0LPG5_MYCCL|nr:predicted protein [Mycena chlorophos]